MLSSAGFVLALLLFQYPYPSRQMANAGGADTGAVATFKGTFKSADKKFVTVEVESGQTLRMYIKGSTKFWRDDKPAKAADFRPDEKVTVDTSRDARMNLIAVRIELVKPGKADKAPEPRPDLQ